MKIGIPDKNNLFELCKTLQNIEIWSFCNPHPFSEVKTVKEASAVCRSFLDRVFIFYFMSNLESDEMLSFLANDILTLTFYCIFGYLHASIPVYLLICIIAYLHCRILPYLHLQTGILTYLHTCIPTYPHTCLHAYLQIYITNASSSISLLFYNFLAVLL